LIAERFWIAETIPTPVGWWQLSRCDNAARVQRAEPTVGTTRLGQGIAPLNAALLVAAKL
jgi:hypothetical protein